jgi:hypothetical protein
MPDAPPAAAGLTVAEVARRYRVSGDKVRRWLRTGEMAGINTSATLAGRPRFIITQDSLAAFERRRSTAAPPRPARRKKRTTLVDYYPETEPFHPAAGNGSRPGPRATATGRVRR